MSDNGNNAFGLPGANHKALYLYPGMIFASGANYRVTTILGSCVSVCLWDERLTVGGINHFLLPLWNGEGLPSPRYGNIAIQKLVGKMINLGSRREDLVAKVFGGASIMNGVNPMLSVGGRNVLLARDMLEGEGIKVASSSVGGEAGRKIIFDTSDGVVMMKRLSSRFNQKWDNRTLETANP